MIPFKDSLQMIVPRNPAFLPPLLAGGTAFFRAAGGTKERSLRLELALEELFMMLNRKEEDAPEEPLHISFRRAPLGTRIVFREPRRASSPDILSEEAAHSSPEQLSIFLMRQMADLVTLSQHQEGHMEYHLFFSPGETAPPFPSVREKVTPEKLQVVRLEDLETSQAAAAAAFAQEMPLEGQEFLGSPKKLQDLLLAEKLLPCCIKNQEGTLLGLCGLLLEDTFPMAPRILSPIVHPDLDYFDMGRQMLSYLKEKVISRGFRGLFAVISPKNPQIMKLFEEQKFARCARIPGYFGANRADIFSAITGPVSLPPFYATWEDQRYIDPLLRSAGFSPLFAKPQTPPPLIGRSTLEITMNPGEKRGEIRLRHFGVDVFLQTQQVLGQLRKSDIRHVLLFLPLEKPHTEVYAPRFKEMGFTLCGVFPGFPTEAQLLLQADLTP